MPFAFKHLGALYLDNNPLGLEGVLAVGKFLSSVKLNGEEFNLYWRRCQLTTNCLNHNKNECEMIEQQLHQLPQSNTRWNLYMDNNNFTGEGVCILVGLLHL